MSRHRRAAPSIMAAAPTAPRRRSPSSTPAPAPRAPSRASWDARTPSSRTVDHRIPGSMAGTGETSRPSAPAPPGTARAPRVRAQAPEHVRDVGPRDPLLHAGEPHPVRSGLGPGRRLPPGASPARHRGARRWLSRPRRRWLAASVPAGWGCRPPGCPGPPRRSRGTGPGNATRPSSSRTMAVSTMPRALPPWASGSARPSQPSRASSFQRSSRSPRGSSHSARTTAAVTCSSRNARAVPRRSCWSGLRAKSTPRS